MHQYGTSELKAILKSRGQSAETAGAKGKKAAAVLAGRLSAYLAAVGEAEQSFEPPDVNQKAKAAADTKLDTSAGSAGTPAKSGNASKAAKRPTPY